MEQVGQATHVVSPAAARRKRAAPPPDADDPDLAAQLDAGLDAFFTIAKRWALTNAEQIGMLAISEPTLRRWRAGQRPAPTPDLADRLSFLVAIYARVEDWAGDSARAAHFARTMGPAPSPEVVAQTLIETMSSGRLLDLQRAHLFVEALSTGAA
jgi:hypothetical protein